MRLTSTSFGNISFATACLLLAALAGVRLYDRFSPSGARLTMPAQEDPFARGAVLGWVQPAALRPDGMTALLVLNSQCRYCDESVPFYQQLLAAGTRKARIVAASVEPEAQFKRYLADAGLKPDLAVHFERMNVPGTPTLVVIDSQGKVLRSWLGKLSSEQEDEISKLLIGP